MLSVMVNIIAFYFGAVVLERTNSLLGGVAVFLFTALPGTILSTMFEVSVRALLTGRHTEAMEVPREVQPSPSHTGSR